MTDTITLGGKALTAAQVAEVLAQLKEAQDASEAAAKAKREQGKAITSAFVGTVVDALDEQTFTSGARGYSLGGSKVAHGGKTYRVSILIRDEATIPAKEK